MPGTVPRAPHSYSCSTTTPPAVDGKQESLSVLSQGFALVPHYPGLMRSPEPLPDPQSLPETADHCFLQGRFPPHHTLGLLSYTELSLKSQVVLANPREDSTSLSGPKDSTPAPRPTHTETPQVGFQNPAWNSYPPRVYLTSLI